MKVEYETRKWKDIDLNETYGAIERKKDKKEVDIGD